MYHSFRLITVGWRGSTLLYSVYQFTGFVLCLLKHPNWQYDIWGTALAEKQWICNVCTAQWIRNIYSGLLKFFFFLKGTYHMDTWREPVKRNASGGKSAARTSARRLHPGWMCVESVWGGSKGRSEVAAGLRDVRTHARAFYLRFAALWAPRV